MKFSFNKLNAHHASEWQSLRLEGVRDFPLGFLVTEEEALKTSEDRAKDILSLGFTRGVFDRERLIGFCGYRPEQLERTRHRAKVGPFFVSSTYHGSGAASILIEGVISEACLAGIEQLELFVDS